MNETIVKQAIYDAIRRALPGLTVILADQNERRPPRPYLSFKIMTGPAREGWDFEEIHDGDQGMIMTGVRTITVSINFFGTGALSGMSQLQSRLQWYSVRAILALKSLVYVTDSGVRDLSQLLETQTETRAQMDVTFRLSVQDVDTGVGTVESVEITDTERGTVYNIP